MPILIDPGHGGKDPGAVKGDWKESDIAYDIASRLLNKLSDQGIEVGLSRLCDEDPANTARAKMATEARADALVSIHCNAAGSSVAKGYEVIIAPVSKLSSAARKDSLRLAETVAAHLHGCGIDPRTPSVKSYDKLGRGESFKITMLDRAKVPAILIEVGFLSNKHDREIFTQPEGQDEIAQRIANAVVEWLNINKKQEEKPMAEKKKDKEAKGLAEWAEILAKKDAATGEALAIWEELVELFKDGRIDASEVPVLLDICSRLLKAVASILGVLAVDPKVSAILGVVAGVLASIATGLEEQMPKIETAWKVIAHVLEDKEVDIKEVPALLESASNLIEATIQIALPFLSPDFAKSAKTLSEKIARVIHWIDRFTPGRKAERKGPSIPI